MSPDALTSTSDSPAGRYATLLWRLTSSGQWERALEVARDWLGEDPNDARAHLAAGQALIHLQKYPEAKDHLEKALAGDPRANFAHRLLSIACYHLREYHLADEHIQQAISLEPNDPTNWYHLAYMRYRAGSLETAAKHARRALMLAPNDANTLNLLTLCEGHRGPELLARYERALELDPANESIHNNIGTYYLDVEGDLPAAEACFRRALSFDPSNKTAQQNLFVVLRRRDVLYRLLQSPRTLVDRLSWGNSRYGKWSRVALLGLWLALGKFFVGILVFWLLLIFPLVKIYEYLTLGDIRAQAGVPGARRGGPFGFYGWPLRTRFSIFAVLCVLFWGTVIFLARDHLTANLVLVLVGVATAWFVGVFVWRSLRQSYRNGTVRRAEKRLNRKMNAPRP